MNIRFLYPEGLKKALTFSYDDGQVFDRKLVSIFNEYGLKGTFHLNSGNLRENSAKGKDFYVAKDELRELYSGHEIACHGSVHKNPVIFSVSQMAGEIYEDRKELERISGSFVQGMSYAFGAYSEEIKKLASFAGIKYSRTVNETHGFFSPADFMEWHPTCHHTDSQLMELAEKFINVPGYVELPLMYVWGHSFEFGSDDSWWIIENFARKMSFRNDIWYASNIEIYRYLSAIRALEFSSDEKCMFNPTAYDVWYVSENELRIIHPGEEKLI